MASHFSGEAPARLKSPGNALEDEVRMVFHPVQGRIRKSRIEFRLEREMIGIDDAGVQASTLGRLNHVRRSIDANHICPRLSQSFTQNPIPAADVQDAFA